MHFSIDNFSRNVGKIYRKSVKIVFKKTVAVITKYSWKYLVIKIQLFLKLCNR